MSVIWITKFNQLACVSVKAKKTQVILQNENNQLKFCCLIEAESELSDENVTFFTINIPPILCHCTRDTSRTRITPSNSQPML